MDPGEAPVDTGGGGLTMPPIVLGLLAGGILLYLLMVALTRHDCAISDGFLTIEHRFAGISGWVYRCPLTNVAAHKYPASIFDMGPLGGHVLGPPWGNGLVFEFKKPWWFSRRAFLSTNNVAEIAAILDRERPAKLT
jgi:hypothetical protein